MTMNEAQKRAVRNRQLDRVALEPDENDGRPPAPVIVQRPMSEIAAELRPDVGPGVPIATLRFNDKSFQLEGMQSGDSYSSRTENNGRVHAIELVNIAGVGTFMCTFVDPARRRVVFEFIERSSVKTWRMADPK